MKLILYVLKGCPYCDAAIQEVKKRKINNKVIVVTPEQKAHYKNKHDMSTFPQIFMENKGQQTLIGGYSDLMTKL